MAICPHPPPSTAPIASGDSDYGSDIDDVTADNLFSQNASFTQPLSPVNELESPFIAELEEDVFTHNQSVRLAKLRQQLNGVDEAMEATIMGQVEKRRARGAAVEVEYDEWNRANFSPPRVEEAAGETKPPSLKDVAALLIKEKRSPLQRYKPRAPLSVTNLVTPSWCEQQYEFNLAKYGRVPRTKAMKAGSSTHKVLEEQVHVEVPVEVESREDRQGLKLWNTIQGLRALRDTGLTRELEVWAVLEGEVVNGIIDEITVDCPDAEMETQVLQQMRGSSAQTKKQPSLAPDQRTLTSFLTNTQGASILEGSASSATHAPPAATLGLLHADRPGTTYYIKDVKTTNKTIMPAQNIGAHYQLQLYHLMLSSLAANDVPAQQVFDRYRLDGNVAFSDRFIAELAELDMRAFVSVPDEVDLPSSQSSGAIEADTLAELLNYNTLLKLWALVITEMQLTFPFPRLPTHRQHALSAPAQHCSISPLLTIEYRTTNPGYDPFLGTRSFALDAPKIEAYVKDEMRWWKGERPTVGVPVAEARKCQTCAFADVCEWRATKVEEGLERARKRREGLAKASV